MSFFFFFKQKTAYEMLRSLVGSEMCIRDRVWVVATGEAAAVAALASKSSVASVGRRGCMALGLSLIHI